MQSCLEKRGIDERNTEIVRSDYNYENQYSRSHKDAESDGDILGRGSKTFKGHSTWKPHMTNDKHLMNYNNFDTMDDTIGTCYDINGRNDIGGRKKSRFYSIYGKDYQYGRNIVETKLKK